MGTKPFNLHANGVSAVWSVLPRPLVKSAESFFGRHGNYRPHAHSSTHAAGVGAKLVELAGVAQFQTISVFKTAPQSPDHH
jgi:hypothetical protein